MDQLNPTQVDAAGLKTPSLVEEALMPMLFAMFGVSEVGAWNFPASQYRVDEFMFQCKSPFPLDRRSAANDQI